MKNLSSQMFATCAWAVVFVNTAGAHGLVQDPPSRNWTCGFETKPDEVTNGIGKTPKCGEAFADDFAGGYNFMSVLTHAKGRAFVTPLPENVCGFNAETFAGKATPWDKAIDWPTTPMTAGPRTFTWNISWGPHFSDSDDFRYWITKPGFQFQVGKALQWADFEERPFCDLKYDDANPNGNPAVVPLKASAQFETKCTVPPRSGRHVIYAEWGRNQFTFERFHGCIDVAFNGTTPPVDTPPVTVTSRFVSPFTNAQFTGAGSVVLDGRGSQGAGLSYRWTVTAPNNAAYTIESPDSALTTLRLLNPSAKQTVRVALQVSSARGSDSSVQTFEHSPSAVVSPVVDLGVLTPKSQTYQAGDTVQLRVVTRAGNDIFLPPQPLVLTSANAAANQWPLALAQAVNTQNANVRVGVLGANRNVQPTANATANRIYAINTSDLAGAFLVATDGQTPPPNGGGNGGVTTKVEIYTDWRSGYCANVTVTNNASTAQTWTAALPIEGKVNSVWNARYTQTGGVLNISAPDHEPSLAPGASARGRVGFCAQR